MSGASFGDDRGHPDAAATHNRTALRLRRRQRGCGLPTAGPRRVRLRPTRWTASASISARRQGRGSKFLVASRFSRRSAWRQWREPARSGTAAAAAGGDRCTRRRIRLLAEVDEAYGQMSGLRVLRRRERAPRDDLQRPRLQPARLRDVPREAHRVDEDAGDGRGHRPAPGPGARGPAGSAWTPRTATASLYLLDEELQSASFCRCSSCILGGNGRARVARFVAGGSVTPQRCGVGRIRGPCLFATAEAAPSRSSPFANAQVSGNRSTRPPPRRPTSTRTAYCRAGAGLEGSAVGEGRATWSRVAAPTLTPRRRARPPPTPGASQPRPCPRRARPSRARPTLPSPIRRDPPQ